MKVILLVFLTFGVVSKAFTQDRIYTPFKLDLAAGLLFPVGTTYLDERFLVSVEPKYNLSDQFSLGLRFEVDPYSNFAGTSELFKINSVSSYLLTGDYFFNKSTIRPFLGVGAGLFKQTLSNSDLPETKTKSEKPGLETRLGLEWKHLRIAGEYNATFFKEEKKMNYVSLKIGAFLWGAPKNK